MERRDFIRLIGGGTIVAASTSLTGCLSSDYPLQALEAWNGPPVQETEPRRRALAYAITAPNPHNRQPWLVDLREANVITLYTDPQKLLPETDPFGRQILIGHGAFLELLVIALAEQGFAAHVALWPQGELPATLNQWATNHRPIARLTLQSGAQKDALFAQILNRHTSKVPYDVTRPVAPDKLRQLLRANEAIALSQPINVGGTVESALIANLRELCFESAKVEVNTPRTLMESIRLVRVGPDEILQHRDGVSINSPAVRALTAFGMFNRNEPPALGSAGHTRALERFEGTSRSAMGFVWLTGRNTRTDQINTGRAYVRLQLQSTAMGIAMHPMSQALQEFAEMKPHYERAHQLVLNKPAPASAQDETVQMLCRIGYSAPVSATPRRRLENFVMKV